MKNDTGSVRCLRRSDPDFARVEEAFVTNQSFPWGKIPDDDRGPLEELPLRFQEDAPEERWRAARDAVEELGLEVLRPSRRKRRRIDPDDEVTQDEVQEMQVDLIRELVWEQIEACLKDARGRGVKKRRTAVEHLKKILFDAVVGEQRGHDENDVDNPFEVVRCYWRTLYRLRCVRRFHPELTVSVLAREYELPEAVVRRCLHGAPTSRRNDASQQAKSFVAKTFGISPGRVANIVSEHRAKNSR